MTKPTTSSTTQRRGPVRNRPAPMALEQRLMFDAAGAVDVAGAAADAFARETAPADAQRAATAAAPAEPAAPLPAAIAPDSPAPGERREVAFVDTGVVGYQALVAGIRPGVEVVLVDAQASGLAQLATWADSHSGYDAIHVLSHGAEGLVYLGRDSLSAATIGSEALQAQLQQLGRALAADGDLMFYGCGVADGEAGQAFLRQLATATGADVAASTDATGATTAGGNWVLEQRTGVTGEALQVTSFGNLLANETLSVAGASIDPVNSYGPNVGAELTSGEAGSTAGHIEVSFTDSVTGTTAGYVSVQDLGAFFAGASGKGIYHAVTDGSDMAYGEYKDADVNNRIDADSHDTRDLVIRRTDGAAFSLKELQVTFLNDLTLKVSGYSAGNQTGQVTHTQSNVNSSGLAQAVSLNSLFTGNAAFDNVDVVRVTATSYTTSWAQNLVDGSLDLLDTGLSLATRSITIGDVVVADSTPPTVTGVTASTANGSYKVGDVIAVQVNFSESVTVTGTPQLTLETGSTDRIVNYASGSGSSTLTFNYTVQAGDTSADLDAIGTNALALNGGTIRDAAGNNATLTLASPGAANSLGANKALVVDGVLPTVTSTAVAGSPAVDATSLTFNVQFGEAVTGVDASDFTLTATGTASGSIASVSGSGSSYSVVVNSVAGTGTLRLDLKASGTGIADGVANAIAAGYTAGSAFSVDHRGVFDANNAAFSFGGTPTRIAGAGTNVGTAYLYSNVITIGGQQIDAIVTLTALNNATLDNFDSGANPYGNAGYFQPNLTIGSVGGHALFNFAFIEGGSYDAGTAPAGTAVVLRNVLANTYDLDGSGSSSSGRQFTEFSGIGGYTLSSTTQLAAPTDQGGGITRFVTTVGGNITSAPGTVAGDNIRARVSFDEVSQTTVKVGDLGATGLAYFGIDFSAGATFTNARTVDVAISGGPVTTTEAGGTGNFSVVLTAAPTADVTVTLTGLNTGEGSLSTSTLTFTSANWNAAQTVTVTGVDDAAIDGPISYTLTATTTSSDAEFNGRTAVVTVTNQDNDAANAAPAVGNLGGDAVSFTEGGSAVLLDAGGNATVTDGDSVNFATGTLTASIVSNRSTGEDLLAVLHQGNGAGQIGVSGNTISYGGTAIGTVTGGSGSNDLVVSFNSSATPAAAQALVRALTYSNGNTGDPSTAQRTVRVTLTDGDGGTSTAADVAVTVVPVNDAPTLSATGAAASFTEGGAAVDLFSSPAIGTVEAGQSIDRLTLTVANASDGAQELLSIDGSSIALSNGNSATTAGNGLAVTVSVASGTATVTLSKAGGISAATAQSVVDGLAWRSTSDAPGTATRTITLTSLRDTGGTANGGADSSNLSVAATVSVVAVNDGPAITAPGSINVTEDQPSPLTGLSFGDADAAGGSVTVSLSAPTGMLGASSGGGVTATGAGTGTLTLTGAITDINSFIAAGNLAYVTATDASGNVTLTVGIDDGGSTGSDPGLSGTASSEAASTTVTLAIGAVNDAPVNTVPGAQSLAQDGQLVFSSANGNAISIADIDAGAGTVRITLSATHGLLSLSGTTGLVFAVGSGTGDTTMTVDGTQADINNALAGLSYTPTPGYGGAAEISLTTSDLGLTGSGGTLTDTDTIALTVNPSTPVVTSLHSSSANGRYGIGETIVLTVTFDQAVVVDSSGGTPSLLLETGGTDRAVAYLAGSGTTTLSFSYTVQEGDLSPDLDTTGTGALSLNGATIRGLTGSDAILTLPAVGGPDSIAGQHAVVVDGVRPTASIVVADTALAIGETSLVTITFSEAVSGFSTADLSVANGSLANLGSADGGITWTATFTPSADVEDTSNLVTLDNSGVADAAGNTGSGTTDSNNHAIDTRRPTIALSSSATTLRAGQTATIGFTLTEPSSSFGADDVAVSGGTLSGFSGSGSSYTALFTPTAGSTGTATMQVASSRFSDGAGNANADGSDADNQLSITVDTLAPAVAAGQQFSYAENRSSGALLGTVATDDAVDVNAFEISGGNTAGWFAIDASGRLTLTATGAAALAPANDHEVSPNSFTLAVRARDAAGNWSAAVDVQLLVTDLNDNAPLAPADVASTPEDTPVTVDVLANDSDADDDALAIRSASVAPAQGTVAIVGGRLVFTPAADFNGTATITYLATDGTHDSAPATLTVSVAPVDDASVLAPDAQTVAEDSVASGNLLANDSDIDNRLQVASFRIAGDDTAYTAGQTATINGVGTLLIGADGGYTFTPAANWNGNAPLVTYTTNTGAGSTLVLQVSAVADAVQVSSPVVNEASPFAVFNVTGVAGEAVQLQLDAASADGSGTDFGASGAANLEVSTDFGATWQAVDGPVTLPAGGTLLARTPVTDDGLRDNGETFTLAATPAGGAVAIGTATIKDDGSGTIFGANGQVDANARPSDDRPVSISSPEVNEASPWAVFTVTGSAGQRLALQLAGGSAGLGEDVATALEYFDGSTWQPVTGEVTLAGATLLVRVAITNDGRFEGAEQFMLRATPPGGTAAAGTATLRDDGAGTVFDERGQPAAAAGDDDRPRPAAAAPAAAAPAPAPVPVQVSPPVPAAAAPVWLPQVIDPVSPVSGGEVHTLTVGERTPDQFFGLNSDVRFPLPLGLFNASRPTEQLSLSAEQADGRALPPWLSFNPTSRTFEGKPPAGLRGEMQIKVSARDASGNQADVIFRLQIGEDLDPAKPDTVPAPAADPRQPARKTERPGRVSLQQQLKDLAPPRRTVADLPRATAQPVPKG